MGCSLCKIPGVHCTQNKILPHIMAHVIKTGVKINGSKDIQNEAGIYLQWSARFAVSQ